MENSHLSTGKHAREDKNLCRLTVLKLSTIQFSFLLCFVVKEAGASFVRQISNSGNQTMERQNSLNLERRDSQRFERRDSLPLERQNSQTMERRNSRTLERMNSIGMERRVSSGRLSSKGSGGRLSSSGSFDEEKIPLTSQLSTIDSDNDSVIFDLDN